MRNFIVKIGEFVKHTRAVDESEAIRLTRLECGDSKLAPEVSETDEAPEGELAEELDADEPGSATGEKVTKSEGETPKPAAKRKPRK